MMEPKADVCKRDDDTFVIVGDVSVSDGVDIGLDILSLVQNLWLINRRIVIACIPILWFAVRSVVYAPA